MKILSTENILFLEEIVRTEKWTSSPELKEFNTILTSLKENSNDEYKYLIDNFVTEARQIPYNNIRKIIDDLICN